MHSNVSFEPSARVAMSRSKHAAKRAQQRGIWAPTIQVIAAFGERTFDGHGAIRCVMTERSVENLRKAVTSIQRLEAMLGTYAVLSADNGTVITVGHWTKHGK